MKEFPTIKNISITVIYSDENGNKIREEDVEWDVEDKFNFEGIKGNPEEIANVKLSSALDYIVNFLNLNQPVKND